ncbi:hypothetical protein J6590_085734, partial [Homalodisca vitripennis]
MCWRLPTAEWSRGVNNVELDKEVRTLRGSLLAVEQHSHSNNLEINGFPLTPSEDVYSVLHQLARIININMRPEDISVTHRLRLYLKKLAHPPVIVQFDSSFPDSTVFLNEHLTGHNKAVLGRAISLQRQGKLHFAGYFNGKTLSNQEKEWTLSRRPGWRTLTNMTAMCH